MSPIDKFDDFVIRGATKVVEGYNYVTGGSREDLRRNIYHTAFIGYPLVEILRDTPPANLAVSLPLMLGGMLLNELKHPFRKEAERKEIEQYESGVKSLDAELDKESRKLYGKVDLAIGTTLGAIGGNGLLLTGLGINNYLKCVEPQTPRKNIVSRMIEKYHESELQPAYVTAN